MPHYLMRWSFKDTAIRALTDSPQDREAAAREVIQAFGGSLLGYWFVLGEHDGMMVADLRDNETAAAVSMRVSASGAFTRFETHPLMTSEEAQRAMRMVKDGGIPFRAIG